MLIIDETKIQKYYKKKYSLELAALDYPQGILTRITFRSNNKHNVFIQVLNNLKFINFFENNNWLNGTLLLNHLEFYSK